MSNKPFVPLGHFYSPYPDVAEAAWAVGYAQKAASGNIAGIVIDDAAMSCVWADLVPFMQRAPFPVHKEDLYRFYYENEFYSYGDALVLHALLMKLQPRRLIEIGSGFSSAVVLDTRDMAGAPEEIILIEPFPDRLKLLLRDSDDKSIDVHDRKVQDCDLKVFCKLGKDDILFVDSSHVAKIGSDVCFILFEILPRLAPGVVVHFHDVFWPFEYPRQWAVDQLRGWNEIYFLRSFLMYNASFDIIFFNNYFATRHGSLALESCAGFMKNPGGGLWLRKNP